MRPERPRFPVDRYLVESSKKVEMVNITDEDIWNPEPALRPEDEIILRKLHEMLQSTADDLKTLSGELSKYREPGVQVKTLPMPLDEEFNEKVHIEEVVNAKFHGHKIVENPQQTPEIQIETKPKSSIKAQLNKSKINTVVQSNTLTNLKKPLNNKKLQISQTKVIQIKEKNLFDTEKENGLNDSKLSNNAAAVNYCEFSYKYTEPKEDTTKKKLEVQKMPSINIRSELTEQKVLHLDILPESKEEKDIAINTNKVGVIIVRHETITDAKPLLSRELQNPVTNTFVSKPIHSKARKVSRLSTDSSSTNVSSETRHFIQKPVQLTKKSSLKSSSKIDNIKSHEVPVKKSSGKRSQLSLELWKKKLNSVYGQPSTSRKSKIFKTNHQKVDAKKGDVKSKAGPYVLNNKMEYIPYSQLTVGGVRASDIEQEISDIPNKHDLPLSPILDKILSSRENSFHRNSPRKSREDPKILTTSDENLLQEVIDIERSITKTISKNLKKVDKTELKSSNIKDNKPEETDSYADDFEDEKSDGSKNSDVNDSSDNALLYDESHSSKSHNDYANTKSNKDDDDEESDRKTPKPEIHDRKYTKKSNLSFKNKVDVFEFVHSINTQDSATQSTNSLKISLKETQTSPRNERPNINPIHNDLWPSIDPREDVSQLLKLEKDLIKKLIIDEYGDLLEKNITKPSTSKDQELEDAQKNVILFQKNTQTSPAHVKSVMTSPTRTKTRTTSPFTLSVPVDHQTSPMICVSNEDLRLEIENVEEDLGISINLSSPRFSLRLPQNTREVLSNFEGSPRNLKETPSKKEVNQNKQTKTFRQFTVSSSSSVDADNSSSEISSLGEVKLKLKRRLRKYRLSSISDSSSSSVPSLCSSDLQTISVLPLRSEGEVSLGQSNKKKTNRRESDGEMSIGRLS